MPAHRSVERFESSHHRGELDTPGFARQAALLVAVMAALLAVALVSGLAWRGIRGYPLTDEH